MLLRFAGRTSRRRGTKKPPQQPPQTGERARLTRATGQPSAAQEANSGDLAERVKRLEQQNELLLKLLKQQPPQPRAGSGPSDSREGDPGSAAPPGGETQPGGTQRGGRGGVGSPDFREGEPGAAAPPGGESRPGGTAGAVSGRWIEVGKDLGLRAGWINYQPWLESNDRSFRIHVGGRTQVDAIWANAPQHVQFDTGGIGKFDDAVNFRRARLEMEGWMYEYFDFKCEYDFINSANVDPTAAAAENTTINTPVPTELWAGINYIPWFGFLRIGNQKNPLYLISAPS